MSILKKIRERPENQKRIFSFVSAGVLTIIIIVAWLSFGDDPAKPKAEESKLSSISPVQMIKDEFSKAFSNFKEATNQDSSSTSSSTIPIEIIDATTTATSIATTTIE